MWQSKKFNTVSGNNTFFNSNNKNRLQPKSRVILHIIKEVTSYDFLAHVKNMQINAGYKPDKWGLSTLNQLDHSGNGLSVFIQSLAFGKNSIVTFPKPIREVEIADVEQFFHPIFFIPG